MIPFLTYPLALVALAALPALAAIYFLRNRYRRRTVSSLMLWRVPARIREGGAKVDRLQLPLIFFLELLILLLLVCGATGPRWQLSSSLRPLMIVLDDSASMLAGTEAGSPRAQAIQALRRLLAQHRVRSLRVVFAGTEPRSAAVPADQVAFLDEALEQWTCRQPTARLDDAILFATELDRGEADLLVLTDHPPPDPGGETGRLRWWAFGSSLPNLAFVSARRTVQGDHDRCLIEIAGYAPQTSQATVRLQADGRMLDDTTITLDPGASHRLTFTLPAGVGPVEAVLPSDALEADNRVFLAVPPRRKVRTQVLLSDDALRPLVRLALEASGLSVAVESSPELVIHQGRAPAQLPNAWDLRFDTAASGTASYTGPFLLDPAHPLTAGVQLDGVVWTASASNHLAGIPVIAAGNVPLLTAAEDPLGRQHLALQLVANASTLTASPAWPTLFWNLLQWRLAESPGLRDPNIRLGDDVEFVTREPVLQMVAAGQPAREVTVRASPVLLRPERAGLHALVTAQTTNVFAVNFLAAEESNLAECATGRWGRWLDERTVRYEYAFAATWFLLIALAGLVVHQFLLARSRTPV
jgi:hypothetical protein